MNSILYGATGNIGKPYFALSTPSHNVTGLVHSPEKLAGVETERPAFEAGAHPTAAQAETSSMSD